MIFRYFVNNQEIHDGHEWFEFTNDLSNLLHTLVNNDLTNGSYAINLHFNSDIDVNPFQPQSAAPIRPKGDSSFKNLTGDILLHISDLFNAVYRLKQP